MLSKAVHGCEIYSQFQIPRYDDDGLCDGYDSYINFVYPGWVFKPDPCGGLGVRAMYVKHLSMAGVRLWRTWEDDADGADAGDAGTGDACDAIVCCDAAEVDLDDDDVASEVAADDVFSWEYWGLSERPQRLQTLVGCTDQGGDEQTVER